MEDYSVIKNNKTLEFDRKWSDMEDLLLSEVSQAMKDIVCIHSIYTDYLHSIIESKKLEDIKAVKVLNENRTVWNGGSEEKRIEKDSK